MRLAETYPHIGLAATAYYGLGLVVGVYTVQYSAVQYSAVQYTIQATCTVSTV